MGTYKKHNCELKNESTCEEDINEEGLETYEDAVADEFADEM
jgi:hypothetical protein